MLQYSEFRARRHFAELDGLRGLCILGVLTAHLKGHLLNLLAGGLGVVVFFVLSGFLITTLALREEETQGRLSICAFMIRRAFRLLPAYYLILGVYAVLILGIGVMPEKRAPFVAALPSFVLYFQEVPYFQAHGGAGLPFFQSWSLGIEEKFYLVWPLLAFVLLRERRRWRLGAAVAGIVLGTLAGWSFAWGAYVMYYAAILAGCAVALLLHEPEGHRWPALLRSRPATGALGVAAVAVQLVTPYAPALRLIFPLVVAVFLARLVMSDGRLARALSNPALVWLGELSYGVYLVHLIIANVVARAIPPSLAPWPATLVTLAFTAVGSTLVAWGLQRTVEGPLRRVGRRLAERARGGGLPAAVSAVR